jgi:DNA-binding LytR/AlgR family response regulator
MELIAIGGGKKSLPENIWYLQSEINYTNIHFTDGSVLKVAYTLKKMEKRFKDFPNFHRCSRSYLLNMKYMVSFDKDKFEVLMPNKHAISVSPRHRMEFMRKFKFKK